jgi:hypothetical protein
VRVRQVLAVAAAATVTAGFAIAGAAPAFAAAPSITDNGDGTIFVDAVGVTPPSGVEFCAPSVSVANCSGAGGLFNNVLFYIDTPSSAFTVAAGHPVFNGGGSPNTGQPATLPAGYYTVHLQGSAGGDDWGGLQGVLIGAPSGTGAPTPIPAWVQAFGRQQAEKCPDGWDASWQSWAESVTGGWVCTRSVPANG